MSSHTQYNLNNLRTPDRSVEKIVWSDDCHLLHLYGAPEHAQTAPTHPYLLHWDRLPCKGVLRVHTGAGLAPPSKHGTLSQASPAHSYRFAETYSSAAAVALRTDNYLTKWSEWSGKPADNVTATAAGMGCVHLGLSSLKTFQMCSGSTWENRNAGRSQHHTHSV